MRIEVKQLKKQFGSTCAVDGLSFEFGAGQIFGFVGPNGAGKTTTMRILATLEEPTGGDVTIDGVSIVQHPERARAKVGFMPDTLPGHRDITVDEYLDFFARAYGLRHRERQSVVGDIKGFTRLSEICHKTLSELSKGMKQRVSLARSLIHDPPVLLLDEPAAGLDPRARIELRELLRALSEQRKAILISSHILTELSEICDGAVIIEQGRLLRAGTLHDLTHEQAHATRVVAIRCLDQTPNQNARVLQRQLLEMPAVHRAAVVGKYVEAEIDQGDTHAANLLDELIRRHWRVVEFRSLEANLEKLFMNVTEGKVQ